MSNQSDNSNVNGNFTALLTVLFIGLKLGHVIDWPWIWVLSPIWISLSLFLFFIVLADVIVFFTRK